MARILVVDDSKLSRRMIRTILEGEGHEIVEAASGVEAIAAYEEERPDLVLLDLVMDEMNGIEVLAKLNWLDPGARVLVATADIQASTVDIARRAGALGVMNKPFARGVVIREVRTALGGDDDDRAT